MNLLYANDRRGAYPDSWYAASAVPLAPFAPLDGDTRADVCIIGGGYTGLSAALHLAEAGADVLVVEAQRVGFGASGRNGGQAGSGQRQSQQWLERRVGMDAARALWDLAVDGKATLQDLITRHGIDAAYRPGVVHCSRTPAEWDDDQREVEHLSQHYGYRSVKNLDRTELAALIGTEAYTGGTLDLGAGHLHPLRLSLGLAQAAAKAGARIVEGTLVTDLTPGAPNLVRTATGTISADHVILAMNGYGGDLAPEVAAHVLPINNYIIATEPLGDRVPLAEDVAANDSRCVVNYWRMSEDGRLLFGGGESYGHRFPRDIAAKVRPALAQVYPQLADVPIDYAWGGTLAVTSHRLPHVARVTPTILSAAGYSGHGVILAVMAGRVLAEALRGLPDRMDTLEASPALRFPGGRHARAPLLALAMTWYALRDRLGI